MVIKRSVMALFILAPLLLGIRVSLAAQPANSPSTGERLATLEDREAIRIVLRDYGRLLDERRFDDFGRLFADDGIYVAGTTTRGPKAIAEGLRRTFAGNPLGLGEPNFHVLFNERITLEGRNATATSQSFFVAPGTDGAPRIVMMASYEDVLVKTRDGWRFLRRVVKGNLSARPAAAQPANSASPAP